MHTGKKDEPESHGGSRAADLLDTGIHHPDPFSDLALVGQRESPVPFRLGGPVSEPLCLGDLELSLGCLSGSRPVPPEEAEARFGVQRVAEVEQLVQGAGMSKRLLTAANCRIGIAEQPKDGAEVGEGGHFRICYSGRIRGEVTLSGTVGIQGGFEIQPRQRQVASPKPYAAELVARPDDSLMIAYSFSDRECLAGHCFGLVVRCSHLQKDTQAEERREQFTCSVRALS